MCVTQTAPIRTLDILINVLIILEVFAVKSFESSLSVCGYKPVLVQRSSSIYISYPVITARVYLGIGVLKLTVLMVA